MRFDNGLPAAAAMGIPTLLALSACGFMKLLDREAGAIEPCPADGGGGAGAPTRSLPTGFVLVWSIPAVLRIEGLSEWGLKEGAFGGTPGEFWIAVAARAL